MPSVAFAYVCESTCICIHFSFLYLILMQYQSVIGHIYGCAASSWKFRFFGIRFSVDPQLCTSEHSFYVLCVYSACQAYQTVFVGQKVTCGDTFLVGSSACAQP